MKKSFSSNIGASLNGRTQTPVMETPPEEKAVKKEPQKKPQKAVHESKASTKKDLGFGLKADGTPKKSNAGRKKYDNPEKKKKQMVLTLTPDTFEKLQEWASSKPRSAPNYVSDFVEEHIDDIIK
jgi:hypothetical protein